MSTITTFHSVRPRRTPVRRRMFLASSIALAAAFGLLLTAQAASAASFYVRQGASGNGIDWTNAWGSPASINWSSVNPGDTIYLAGGTYGAFSGGKSGTAGNPITLKKATASDHGTVTGWSDSYDTRVIIDGNGVQFSKCIDADGTNYITIDGAVKYGIWLRNAEYGIHGDPANNLTVRYVEAGDGGGTFKLNEDAIQGRGNNLLVEYSYFHDNDNTVTHGDSVQWYGGDNLIFRYNVMKNSGQIFMFSWDPETPGNIQIYYNVFYNRGGTHYNGISKQVCPAVGKTWKVYNNTFDLEATSDDGYNNLWSGAGSCAQQEFINNAVIYSNAYSLGGLTHRYNGFDNSGQYIVFNIPTETGRVTATDLGFVNVSSADYHLTVSSPLIGKGTNVGLTRDFDGNLVSGTPSIGAFEYGGTPPPPDTTPPSAPTNLSATAVSSSQINLSWAASSDPESGIANYELERCTGASCTNFAQIATPTGTSHTDTTGLTANTTYSYRVRAKNGASPSLFSGYSSIAPATTPSTSLPSVTNGTILSITADTPLAFNLVTAGTYKITGTVTTFDIGTNSFYAEMDTNPAGDDTRTWDIAFPVTNQLVDISQRGINSVTCFDPACAEFNPKTWTLALGTHTLYLNTREAGTGISTVKFSLTTATKSADLNGDGIVNSLDWSIMNSQWGTAGPSADLDSDGVVNSLDWSVMNGRWGTGG